MSYDEWDSQFSRQAAAPKKVKTVTKVLSQAELIALALDNEEGNIVEHRDYLKNEDEKRRRARVVRETVTGPLLRWVSRGEEIKIMIPPPSVSSHSLVATSIPFSYGTYHASGTTPYGHGISSQQSQPAMAIYNPYIPQMQASTPGWLQPPAQPMERTEKVARNYVAQELAQYDGAPNPSWMDTMSGMFGNHVKWDEVKVYVGKSRPMGLSSPHLDVLRLNYHDFHSSAGEDVSNYRIESPVSWSKDRGTLCGFEGLSCAHQYFGPQVYLESGIKVLCWTSSCRGQH